MVGDGLRAKAEAARDVARDRTGPSALLLQQVLISAGGATEPTESGTH